MTNTNADANGLDVYVRDLLRADAMIVDIEIAKIARDLRNASQLKVPDAVIAATALHNRLTLVTEDRQLPEIPNLGPIGYEKFMAQIGAPNE